MLHCVSRGIQKPLEQNVLHARIGIMDLSNFSLIHYGNKDILALNRNLTFHLGASRDRE